MMYFILRPNHFFYFLCIFITQTISIPTKQCNISQEDCIINQNDPIDLQLTTLTTTNIYYSSTSNVNFQRHSYDFNLKIIAIVSACIIFIVAMIRLCIAVYNSLRASNNVLSNRRTSVVRPQIRTIRPNHFKPDLPPTYADAIATIDNDENKLPSYDQLSNTNA